MNISNIQFNLKIDKKMDLAVLREGSQRINKREVKDETATNIKIICTHLHGILFCANTSKTKWNGGFILFFFFISQQSKFSIGI